MRDLFAWVRAHLPGLPVMRLALARGTVEKQLFSLDSSPSVSYVNASHS